MTGNDQAKRTPMTSALKPLKQIATRRVWPLLALLMATPGHAVERHYTGVAYAADTDQVRYREEHWLFDDHGVQTRLVLYRCPAGQPFAKKTMRYLPRSDISTALVAVCTTCSVVQVTREMRLLDLSLAKKPSVIPR